MADQYAKPRSADKETIDGITLPCYRGDAVNEFEVTPEARRPNPHRMVEAYHVSSSTLNLIRAFTTGGFADLRHVNAWKKCFLANNSAYRRYEAMTAGIDRRIRIMVR